MIKKNNEGFCKVCGKSTNFYILSYGYYKFCSKECENKDISNRNIEMHKKIGKQIHEKKKKTNLERYGVEHNTQRKEVMDTIKKTNIKKYGVDNVIKKH